MGSNVAGFDAILVSYCFSSCSVGHDPSHYSNCLTVMMAPLPETNLTMPSVCTVSVTTIVYISGNLLLPPARDYKLLNPLCVLSSTCSMYICICVYVECMFECGPENISRSSNMRTLEGSVRYNRTEALVLVVRTRAPPTHPRDMCFPLVTS